MIRDLSDLTPKERDAEGERQFFIGIGRETQHDLNLIACFSFWGARVARAELDRRAKMEAEL